MATIYTSLTPLAHQTMFNGGLKNNIMYYSFNDTWHLYNVTATNNVIPSVTGERLEVTLASCSKAEAPILFSEKPTESEIKNAKSRVKVLYNGTNCGNQFSTPNLNIKVNINSWLHELSSLTYGFNMTQSLTQVLWDYISAEVQTLDLVSSDYKTTNITTNLKFSQVPKTEEDFRKYTLFSPRYVVDVNGQKRVEYNNGVKYPSPFIFTFGSNNFNGINIPGTSGLLSLVPGEWGYIADGIFLPIETVEGASNLDQWNTVLPAVKVGNGIYSLNNNGFWDTQNGLIGYLMNMVDSNGKNAVQALIEQVILFMKTNGDLNSDGSYSIKTEFTTNIASSETNNIDKKIGNNIIVNFSYNPTDISSSIIQLFN